MNKNHKHLENTLVNTHVQQEMTMDYKRHICFINDTVSLCTSLISSLGTGPWWRGNTHTHSFSLQAYTRIASTILHSSGHHWFVLPAQCNMNTISYYIVSTHSHVLANKH